MAKAEIPEHLVVRLSIPNAINVQDSEWQTACEQLGSSLSVGKGMFGLGLFTSYECQAKERMTPKEERYWILAVAVTDQKTTIEIFRSESDKKAMAVFAFDAGSFALRVLSDPNLSALIGYSLLDQMPALLRVTNANLVEGKVTGLVAPDFENAEVPRPPEELVFYTLQHDSKRLLWIPSYLGKGRNRNQSEKPIRLHQKAEDLPPLWHPNSTLSSNGDVLAHDHLGRKTRVSAIAELAKTMIGSLVSDMESGAVAQTAAAVGGFFANLGSSGYLGLRYGLPLLPGEVISKSTFLGALAEIRSGFFDGLKMYYDYWPEVVDEINGAEGAFGGQRFILGYSLSHDFDSIISAIDITPKVGAWTYTARFPYISPEDPNVTQLLEFKVKNAPSLELEFGVESSDYWYILRAWASRALSTSFSSNQASVNNMRAGMDLMIRGPSFSKASNINVSFLVFVFGEQVILQRAKKDRDQDTQLAIDNIDYSQGYAGGGFAISW